MRIGKIGQPIGFNGIWEVAKINKFGTIGKNSTPLYQKLCIYHPFADETDSEIKDALVSFKTRNGIKAVIDTREDIIPAECKAPDAFIIPEFILGEPANMTKNEFLRMEKTKENYVDRCGVKSGTLRNLNEDEKELLDRYI